MVKIAKIDEKQRRMATISVLYKKLMYNLCIIHMYV